MKTKTLLCVAMLAMASVSASSQESVIKPEMLKPADMSKASANPEMPKSLQILLLSCGQPKQAEIPFSEEELDALVEFGTKSDKLATKVCRMFHGRRAA